MESYGKQILKVLVYIETHIEEELSMEALAKVACYSPFHFHRIFQKVVGETVHKYVKRLRLEKAAGKLRHTETSVTEIALEANFDTPSAFARAFKQSMGATPNQYRSLSKELNAVTQKIKEIAMIHPDKIEKISDIPLLFIRRYGDYVTSSQSAWDAMIAFVKKHNLDSPNQRYISISHDDPHITDEEKLRFDACIQAPKGFQEMGEVGRQTLKGGKYAIFTHKGPHDTIGEAFDSIFFKWFPDTKEEIDESRIIFCEHFHLEYVDKDESKLVTKIYVPVV